MNPLGSALSPVQLTPRGTDLCRGCARSGLVTVLDLGVQALSNEMVTDAAAPVADFPLHLRICPQCGLGQVGEFVLPDRIFAADYPYQSSMSTSWLAHAGRFVRAVVQDLHLTAEDLVVEIASNDGYLLAQMAALGPRVLGIEPAAGVAELARARGVSTEVAFFGEHTAGTVLAAHGSPRLIVANNVMAHVPDLEDFLRGMATLSDARTVISVENPTFLGLLTESLFDTIYHEHFSYLSAHAVAEAVQRVGLELWDIEELPTHGGSYRYWLALAGARTVTGRVTAAIEKERAHGLLSPELWTSFAQRSQETISGFAAWLAARRAAGDRVAGYGAAAKGNTLLNAVPVTADSLLAIADASPEKQGKLSPGSRIPVCGPEDLPGLDPDAVVIFPWNIATELVPLIRERSPRAEIWTAVPRMRRLHP